MKFFLVLMLVWGLQTPSLGTGLDLTRLHQKLIQVQQRSFPELEHRRLRIGRFEEADSFFQSSFEPLSLLGDPVYLIEVNPRLLDRACPDDALEAVLAHELSHSLDYERGRLPGVLAILWQLLIDPAAYEHRTDLQAIFRGYGPGLIRYREWLYAQLSPEQIARKQRIYYTPAEITLILARLEGLDFAARQALRSRWLARPPLGAREIGS